MHQDHIAPEEPLARYILDKSYFRSSDATVKHNAFMPAKTGELSVFRVLGLDNFDVQKLGETYVAEPRQKQLLGVAQISVSDVVSQGLLVVGTDKPHPVIPPILEGIWK